METNVRTDKRGLFRFVTLPSVILLTLALLSGVIHLLAVRSTAFADFWNDGPAAAVRLVLGKITSVLPFSLGELMAILVIPAVILLAVFGVSHCRRSLSLTCRFLSGVLAVGCLGYTLFVATFAAGYRTTTLDQRLRLDRTAVSAEELAAVMTATRDELNLLCESVSYRADGSSACPDSFSRLSEKLVRAWVDFSRGERYSFLQTTDLSPKRITLSEPMTYTHISGVYTFFTGESNVNTNFPDFVTVYSAAHEMAHQRGISREDEANFLAFLVCVSSDDGYIRYSGYLNLYEYLASALYSASPTLYYTVASTLDSRVAGDLSAYSVFFRKYADSPAAKVSDAVNDAYLSAQGTAGVRSYNLVVDLAVAYYRELSYTTQ